MKKRFDYFILLVLIMLVVVGGGTIFFSPFYFPGFTERQTAELFLEPQNKRVREGVQIKANWHGSDLFDDFRLLTNNFLKKEAYDIRALARFLNEIDTSPLFNEASQLYAQEDLTQKLLGALLLSKSRESQQYPDLFPFLAHVVKRDYPGLNQDLFRSRDFFSEVAILGVGNLRDEQSFSLLVDVLNESPVPHIRHKVACQALAKLQDWRAIDFLHKKMVDPEFHASFAAYQALLILGDKQVEEIVHERLSLGLEREASLLREML